MHTQRLARTFPRSAPDCVAAQTSAHTPIKVSDRADQPAEATPYAMLQVSYPSIRPLTGRGSSSPRVLPCIQEDVDMRIALWSRVSPVASYSVCLVFQTVASHWELFLVSKQILDAAVKFLRQLESQR